MPLLASARVLLDSARKGALPARRRRVLALALGPLLAAGLVAQAQAGTSHRPRAPHGVGPASQAPAQSAARLHVIPFPGTPDADASSAVIFSSVAPSALRSVTVTGSRSGEHTGRIERLPDGSGTEFVPDRGFVPGEHVSVVARPASPAAAAALGAPGARRVSFSFGVAVVGPWHGGPPQDQPAGRAAQASVPTKNFHSRPKLHPTVISASSDPDSTSGEIFITPDHTPQMGPMMLNSKGQLVWFHQVKGGKAANFEVQYYNHKRVLTWWQGDRDGKDGEDVIANHAYKRVAAVKAVGTGYSADLHDFVLVPHGRAFLDAVVPVRANLSGVGGPANGYVWDNVIQEIDIRTGKQLWSWHSYGHIPLNASHKPPAGSYMDAYHLNSFQQLAGGTLLVSSRSTWSIYKISMRTGQILWTLGGKYNQFKRGTGVGWSWQHDARRYGNTLTLFDDGAAPQEEEQSSAKELSLNVSAKTATLVRRFAHRPPLLAAAQGSAQLLPNGNMFVGWGTEPDFTEFNSSGQQIFNGAFPLGETSYRAFRFTWTGRPLSHPAMALAPTGDGHVDVWASWNGATEVKAWRVVGGRNSRHLGTLDRRRYTSFETKIRLRNQPRYFAVQALGAHKQVLGTSTAHVLGGHVSVFGSMAFVPRAGDGAIPVGCFTTSSCSVTLRVTSGRSVLAQSGAQSIRAGRAAFVSFQLSSQGKQDLDHARKHRLPVQVSVRDSSGATASSQLNLIPFSVHGKGPSRSLSESHTIQIVGSTQFVSSKGVAAVLAACYAGGRPCRFQGRIRSSGRTIGKLHSGRLGIDELGFVFIKLNRAGKSMLAHASGNQLAAKIELTAGSHTASGQVALARYS
jgi:hypothetical protein